MTASIGQSYQLVSGTWQCPGRGTQPPPTYTQTTGRLTKIRSVWIGTVTPSFIVGTTKPAPTNVGVSTSVTLADHPGDFVVTVAGTIIDGLRITGRVIIRAANVTVQNCEIVGNGYSSGNTGLVDCNSPSCVNATIQFCTLHQDPTTANVYHDAIIGHDYTALRNYVYDTIDGFGVYNNNAGAQAGPTNVQILGNYLANLAYFSPDPNHPDNRTHNDGIQIQGGTGTVIFGNVLNGVVSNTAGTAGGGPAADPYTPNITGHVVTLTPVVSAISGTDCHSNWIYGGAGGIIVVSNSGSRPSNAGNFYNNRLSGAHLTATPIQYDNNMTGTTFTGNVDDTTGSAITAVAYTPGTI
jgi:hypothetical protein